MLQQCKLLSTKNKTKPDSSINKVLALETQIDMFIIFGNNQTYIKPKYNLGTRLGQLQKTKSSGQDR